jgi:nitrite reductase/ring-hydroxylating ferredoxin subunit
MSPKRRHRVGTTDQISAAGENIVAEVDGQEVAVYNVDGEYHAIANYCIHQAGPLCEGGELTGQMAATEDDEWEYTDDGKIVKCPWHAWTFDVTTGKNTRDERYSVPTYDVDVTEDGEIYVFV